MKSKKDEETYSLKYYKTKGCEFCIHMEIPQVYPYLYCGDKPADIGGYCKNFKGRRLISY